MELKLKANEIKFEELSDVWDKHIRNKINKRRSDRLVSGTFDIGLRRKALGKLTKKNVVNTVCVINIAIPCTAWPVTSPIIKRVAKKIDGDKIIRGSRILKIKLEDIFR